MNSREHKTVRRWARELAGFGWLPVAKRDGQHIQALSPCGRFRIPLDAGTPRRQKNTLAALRRAGVGTAGDRLVGYTRPD